mmetsp:Transcript_8193/g.16109  ORF Transcript_8193/g.16109 Transcript_8193/m.16109 type:complete len:206 (-) Transcript_8193:3660-4277(-)
MASTCRICLEQDAIRALVAPCKCTGQLQPGTQKYVHMQCLHKWQDTVRSNPRLLPSTAEKQAGICPTCQAKYHTHIRDADAKLWRIISSPVILTFAAILLISLVTSHSGIFTEQLTELFKSFNLHVFKPNFIKTDDGMKVAFSRVGWPVEELKQGLLLSATDHVSGSIFKDSVILLVRYSVSQGAVGFIINKTANVHGLQARIGV